jgi:hypothetical protein
VTTKIKGLEVYACYLQLLQDTEQQAKQQQL